MNSIRQTIRTIDDYWFRSGSPTSLGFLRIAIGILTLIDLLVLGLHWEDWFSERGYVPRSLTQMWFAGDPYLWYHGKEAVFWEGGRILPKVNLLSGIENPLWAQLFFWGVAVFCVLTTFGLWTRFSSFMLAIGIVSIHHRNPMILMGGDSVLRIACLYLALSPCGTVCSVDRLIALWKGRVQPGPVTVSLWSQKLISYNVVLIYITTVWIKWYGAHWKAGDAAYYPAQLPEFFRFPYPHFLFEMPVVRFFTWGTLVVEFLMGTLVFYRPMRKYILLGGILLHGGIEYTMNVPLFGYLIVSCYITFFDGEEVSAWFARIGQRFQGYHVTVHLPVGHTLKPNAQAVLSAIDPLSLVSYTTGEEDGVYVTKADGTRAKGLWAIVTHSMGAWPVVAMPWIWKPLITRALEA